MSNIIYKGAAYTRLKFSDDPRHDPSSPEFNYDEPPPPKVEIVDEDWLGDDLPPDWYEKAKAKPAVVYQGALYEPLVTDEAPQVSATQAEPSGLVLQDEELFGFENLDKWTFTLEDGDILHGAVAYSYWEPLAEASDGISVTGVLERVVSDVPVRIRVKATFVDAPDADGYQPQMQCQDFTAELLEPLNVMLQFPDGSKEELDQETANNFVRDAVHEEVIKNQMLADDLLDAYYETNRTFAQHSKGAWKIQ